MGYVQGRKKIYCGLYAKLAPQKEEFKRLKRQIQEGKNILIVEVDGPDFNLNYGPYKGISKEDPCMVMDERNVKFLAKDTLQPFSFGYAIAALLLDGEEWLK